MPAFGVLSWLIGIPILGAFAILCVPRDQVKVIRALAVAATAVVLALALHVVWRFDRTTTAMQFVEQLSWIPPLNVSYHLGVDGVSVLLVFLTALLGFLACLASFGIAERHKEYFAFYLLLETGMLGTFLALDLFLFYVFWEVVLVPMYFLIGIWGGGRREYSAMKFFLYTLAGSLAMLIGILALYFASEPHTFDMLALAGQTHRFSVSFQHWVFLLFFLGFAIKVPIFPFHTWLPDAHVDAPTPISVLLAGVLLKMGGYGFFRISYPILPEGAVWFVPAMAALGCVNIVYGALVAMAQTDFKKMVAYSSVSHMGFVLLGLASLTTTGMNGALLQMFNHGTITGGMFLLVGVLYDRAHTRDLTAFGGLGAKVPVYAGLLSFFGLASLGLPGLSGFIGEVMALLGTYPTHRLWTVLSITGIVITAGYTLTMLQRVLLGPLNPKWSVLPDVRPLELTTLVPLLLIVLAIGVTPLVALTFQEASLAQLATVLKAW